MHIEIDREFCSQTNKEKKEKERANLELCNIEEYSSKIKTNLFIFQMNKSLGDASSVDPCDKKWDVDFHLYKVQKLVPKNPN